MPLHRFYGSRKNWFFFCSETNAESKKLTGAQMKKQITDAISRRKYGENFTQTFHQDGKLTIPIVDLSGEMETNRKSVLFKVGFNSFGVVTMFL